jgi:hypothetical protein
VGSADGSTSSCFVKSADFGLIAIGSGVWVCGQHPSWTVLTMAEGSGYNPLAHVAVSACHRQTATRKSQKRKRGNISPESLSPSRTSLAGLLVRASVPRHGLGPEDTVRVYKNLSNKAAFEILGKTKVSEISLTRQWRLEKGVTPYGSHTRGCDR